MKIFVLDSAYRICILLLLYSVQILHGCVTPLLLIKTKYNLECRGKQVFEKRRISVIII